MGDATFAAEVLRPFLSGSRHLAGLVSEAAPRCYRPRQPRASPLFRLFEARFDELKLSWEQRFAPRYGPWRGFLDTAVARYLACGDPREGFARLFCDSCKHTFLVAFSCRERGLCPSCAAKRGAELAAFLEHEVLAPVDHVQWVWTIPKMLRPYFLHHRDLMAELCRAAYETVAELMAASVSRPTRIRPGFIAAIQSFNSDLSFNPHVHGLASRGAWDEDGDWIPLPYLDDRSAELLFRHKVLAFLRDRELLDDARMTLLLSWQERTGFSVDSSVVVPAGDTATLARLARYFMRAPVSLERLTVDEALTEVIYAPRRGHDDAEPETSASDHYDPLEFLARVLVHVPARRLHMVRYFGAYASVARARDRAAHAAEAQAEGAPTDASSAGQQAQGDETEAPNRKELRRRWADLIRRVYEVDPLVCPRCRAPMRIIAVITEPEVIRKILRHLDRHVPERGPPSSPAEPSAAEPVH
jgi:hypothetical protein